MISQIAVFIFGTSAIWFVGRKESWKRWGYIFGLCGQSFWLYTMAHDQKWGMFLLSCFYTYSWAQGIYNYWIKK